MDLIPEGTKIQVSATAQGTSRRALLSDSEDAWTAPVVPAHVVLNFPEPVKAGRIALTFQGGFVATSVSIGLGGEQTKVYPEDKNARQIFEGVADFRLPPTEAFSTLRLDFEGTSDNQGRITLYRIELLA